jgi:uncharacterized protein
MLFVIACLDRNDAMEVRVANRPAHLLYIEAHRSQVALAGPMLDEADRPIGSLLIMDFPDRAAAQAFVDADPYAQAGLFETVSIRAFRKVFP